MIRLIDLPSWQCCLVVVVKLEIVVGCVFLGRLDQILCGIKREAEAPRKNGKVGHEGETSESTLSPYDSVCK